MDFTVGIFSRNLAVTLNFVEFRDIRDFTFYEASSVGCRKTVFERHVMWQKPPTTCTLVTHVARLER